MDIIPSNCEIKNQACPWVFRSPCNLIWHSLQGHAAVNITIKYKWGTLLKQRKGYTARYWELMASTWLTIQMDRMALDTWTYKVKENCLEKNQTWNWMIFLQQEMEKKEKMDKFQIKMVQTWIWTLWKTQRHKDVLKEEMQTNSNKCSGSIKRIAHSGGHQREVAWTEEKQGDERASSTVPTG